VPVRKQTDHAGDRPQGAEALGPGDPKEPAGAFGPGQGSRTGGLTGVLHGVDVNRRKTKTKRIPKTQPAAWPRHWLAIVVLALVYTLAAILHVRSKLAVVQLGYRLSEVAGEHKRLLADSGKLQVEVATLRSPQRLRRLANGTLGLKEPTPDQVVTWKKNKKLAMGRIE
jgi:cell division protein FtsL